jgi:hypothetical protein
LLCVGYDYGVAVRLQICLVTLRGPLFAFFVEVRPDVFRRAAAKPGAFILQRHQRRRVTAGFVGKGYTLGRVAAVDLGLGRQWRQ